MLQKTGTFTYPTGYFPVDTSPFYFSPTTGPTLISSITTPNSYIASSLIKLTINIDLSTLNSYTTIKN